MRSWPRGWSAGATRLVATSELSGTGGIAIARFGFTVSEGALDTAGQPIDSARVAGAARTVLEGRPEGDATRSFCPPDSPHVVAR